MLVQGSFIFASAMLAEAALSFLGVGVNPEIPTWGNMINAGRDYVGTADWLMVFPGVAIVLAVLSLQMIGDGLRSSRPATAQGSLGKRSCPTIKAARRVGRCC